MLSIMNREALNRRVDQLKRDFCGHLQVEATLGAMTGLINTVVEDAYSQARTVLPHGRNGTALLSTGGYSRHQLHPYSDIDIILLFANPLREEDESFLKRLLHPLWDWGCTSAITSWNSTAIASIQRTWSWLPRCWKHAWWPVTPAFSTNSCNAT